MHAAMLEYVSVLCQNTERNSNTYSTSDVHVTVAIATAGVDIVKLEVVYHTINTSNSSINMCIRATQYSLLL